MKVTGRVTLIKQKTLSARMEEQQEKDNSSGRRAGMTWRTHREAFLSAPPTFFKKKKIKIIFAVPLEGYWTVKWDIVNGHGIGYRARPIQENQRRMYLYGLPPLSGQNISPAG